MARPRAGCQALAVAGPCVKCRPTASFVTADVMGSLPAGQPYGKTLWERAIVAVHDGLRVQQFRVAVIQHSQIDPGLKLAEGRFVRQGKGASA